MREENRRGDTTIALKEVWRQLILAAFERKIALHNFILF